MMRDFIARYRMAFIMLVAVLVHGAAFAFIHFALPDKDAEKKESYEVFKLVDVDEYVPPPPVAPPPETTIVYNQPEASETVVETEKEIIETSDASYSSAAGAVAESEIEYVPQHKISVIPEIPTKDILARIDYPPMALRQGIEGVVYLELFIDQAGTIRKISVLKDPGFGFADAALAALDGIRCKPAMANGVPVATRFRYPVRFAIK